MGKIKVGRKTMKKAVPQYKNQVKAPLEKSRDVAFVGKGTKKISNTTKKGKLNLETFQSKVNVSKTKKGRTPTINKKINKKGGKAVL